MNYSDVDSIHTSSLSCSLKTQYNENNCGLYIKYELGDDKAPFIKFYELCQKMNSIQRKFFIELTSHDSHYKETTCTDYDKLCVFCPGYNLSKFYFLEDKSQESHYKELTVQDKTYIMKWIFSVACAVQILLQNNFERVNTFVRSFFIDSNMEARFSYANWDTSFDRFTIINDNLYFVAPENLDPCSNSEYSYKAEKECSYSLGVIMTALLNKKMPNVYFQESSKNDIISKLKEGHVYKENIPQCKWNKIISNCINIDPEKRPSIKSIIQQLIQEENCLDDVDYSEFKKYVAKKFDSKQETDLTKLFKEKIDPNLSKISENEVSSIQESKFRVRDIPQFLELCKNTSFENNINDNCENLFKLLFNLLQSNASKDLFQNYKGNKYILLDKLLEKEFCEEEEDSEDEDDILNFNCIDNMNDNSSFYIRIYKKNKKIKLVFPQELKISNDFDHFNGKEFFAHIDEIKREIEFYPFLNVYNVLYGNSSSRDFNKKEKLKWLYQTAEALSKLHEKEYTVKYFNSTNIFIDINLDAHFLPSQIIKIQSQNQFDTDISSISDFIISYLAPEAILDAFDASDPEKQLVYSFGIFILELVYNNRPDQLLANLSSSEKIKLLVKERKIFIKPDDSLYKIVKSCLDHNPENRYSFEEIARLFKKDILNETDENNKINDKNFLFSNLEEANNQGATISNVIFDYIYKTFDIDKQLYFEHYNSNLSAYNMNRFELVWAIYTNDIKPKDFIDAAHQNLNNSTKSQFNSYYQNLNNSTKSQFNSYYQNLNNSTKSQFNSCHQNLNNLTKSQFNSFYDSTKDYLDKFSITMKKVHNRSINTYLHLSGLTIQSARNLMLRYQYNINDDYRQQTEYTVRNTYDFPYGDTLKMKNVEDIANDMMRNKIFKPNTVISTMKNGNIKTES